jgi:Smg protein
MFDVLIEILNSLEAGHFDVKRHQDQWGKELQQVGVKPEDLQGFLNTLEKIGRLKASVLQAKPNGGFPLRIYTEEEAERLDAEARGLLLHFETIGLLPPELREIVIDQTLKLEDIEINLPRLRLLILLVLFHQASLDVMLSHYETLAGQKNAVVH